jgi:hypothetical protein
VDLTSRQGRIAVQILVYLIKHPDAKDSLAGIRLWWLDESEQWSDHDVRQAAEALVERGLLRTWESSPDFVVFGSTKELFQSANAVVRELGELGRQTQRRKLG